MKAFLRGRQARILASLLAVAFVWMAVGADLAYGCNFLRPGKCKGP